MEAELLRALSIYGPLGIICFMLLLGIWRAAVWFGIRADRVLDRHLKLMDTLEVATVEIKTSTKATQECTARVEKSLVDHANREEEFMNSIAQTQQQMAKAYMQKATLT